MGRGLARLIRGETTVEVRAPSAGVPSNVASAEAQDAAEQTDGGEPADRPAAPLAAPPVAQPTPPGQPRRRAVELCCVLALLSSVATVGLAAWSASDPAPNATRFHIVLTMSSSDRHAVGGSIVGAPFLTYNEVRLLLVVARSASLTHLSAAVVSIDQANASPPPASKAVTLSTTASEATVTGLGGLYEVQISAPGRQRWWLAIQTPS